MRLPKHFDEMLELANGFVWHWPDRDGRDEYKVYTEDREIAKLLKRSEGVRVGAWGYPIQGCDFICRTYVMNSVLRLLEKPKVQN